MSSSSDQMKTSAKLPALDDSLAKILLRVQEQLDVSKPHKAFDILKAKECSNIPQCKNARGVCWMRMGELDDALRVFRDLCLASGGLMMREDVPTTFKTNLATTLALRGNVVGCLATLAETKDEGAPTVVKLRAAIDDWKRSLSAWQRFMFRLGVEPKAKIQFPFAPGDLL